VPVVLLAECHLLQNSFQFRVPMGIMRGLQVKDVRIAQELERYAVFILLYVLQ
jgi:hypothetical protein